jgi:hypothetical protein
MADLTSNQKSFIERMASGETFERHGFDLLSKREDLELFFDALQEKGLFHPSHNSGPKPAAQAGSFYEPYWAPLEYLAAAAIKAGATNNVALGNKVMAVVRDVTFWKDETGEIRSNSATYWRFAEILGDVPTICVPSSDIPMVKVWMSARFNSGMAGHALVKGAFPHFLSSAAAEDLEKACLLLWECSAFKWNESGRFNHEVELLLENHWFEKLLKRHAADFGTRAGARSSEIFYTRLKELFAHDKRKSTSTLWRPAVEAHKQNMVWHEVENRLVDGLRDVLNAWVDTEKAEAADFAIKALSDDTEMVRRIGIHVVDEHFPLLGPVFLASLSDKAFNIGHVHELYRLLTRHFAEIGIDQRKAIVEIIRALPAPAKADDEPSRHKRVQRLWLSAIAGRGSEEADAWFAELQSDPEIGGLGEHPDFLSYHETRMGPGPSPMAAESIIAFAQEGTLVQQLNAFVETDTWRGPTIGGLCGTVEQAVADEPALFVSVLKSFQAAKTHYQYSVLNGLKRAFDAKKDGKVEWPIVWPAIFQFSYSLVSSEDFWQVEATEGGMDLVPRRMWLASLISDLIQNSARDDVRGYKPDQYPLVRSLLVILLNRSDALTALSDSTDAVNLSINSSKGRAVEALLNHALKECRIANEGGNGHEDAWARLEPIFDAELAKCKNGNFEFSTLVAHYFANVDYLSTAWLASRMQQIFPGEYTSNMAAAVDGLAYAPASGPIFQRLRDAGVIDWALKHDLGENGRERMVERIVLAYLWGMEGIDGPYLSAVISPSRLEDIETAAQFLWGAQGEKLAPEKIELILGFWAEVDRMLVRAKLDAPAVRSTLSQLAVFIDAINDRERDLLLGVAPFVQTHYNAIQFIEQLDRLAEKSPETIAQALLLVLKSETPIYDTGTLISDLILKLAQLGQRPAAFDIVAILPKTERKVLELVEMLNQLPPVQEGH